MKTKIKAVKKGMRRRPTKSLPEEAPGTKSSLPIWVIGAYDGPSDGKLSLREGYQASK